MDQFILEVKVAPKAKQDAVVGFEGEALKVRVTEAPDKGKANEAVIALLAETLSLPKRDIVLVSGDKSRRKRFLLPVSARAILDSYTVKNPSGAGG